MILGTGLHNVDGAIRLITSLLIFLVVLVAAWFVTRLVAGYQKGQIETCRLSQTKYIQIIRIGGRYLVIGICKDTITMLASYDEAELELKEIESRQETFQEVFQRVKEWNHKKEK